MTSTFITAYVGKGLAAARPAAPAIAAGTFGWYWATDTSTLSYYDGTWHTLSASDPTIAPFLTVPANPGFDPLFTGKAAAVVLSNSNRTATAASSSPYNHMMGTPAQYAGKRYYEIVPGNTGFCNLGFTGPAGHLKNGDGANLGEGTAVGQVGMNNSGAVKVCDHQGTTFTLSTIQTWAAGDRVCFALDLDANLFWIRTNAGNWNNNAANNPATGVGGLDLSWARAGSGNTLVWPAMNAGNTSAHSMYLKSADFTQAVPAGFGSWSGV